MSWFFSVLIAAGLSASGVWIAQGPLMTGVPPVRFALAFALITLLLTLRSYVDGGTKAAIREQRARLAPFLHVLLASGALAISFRFRSAGLALFSATIWQWLSFREFYVGASLARAPLLRALARNAVLIPLCAFPYLLVNETLTPEALAFGMMILGASFVNDLAHGLDPEAPSALVRVYGPLRLLPYLGIAGFWSLTGAAKLGLLPLSTLGVALVAVAYLFYLPSPRTRHAWVARLAFAGLVLHAYAYVIQRLVER